MSSLLLLYVTLTITSVEDIDVKEQDTFVFHYEDMSLHLGK